LTGGQRSSLDYVLMNLVDPSAVVGKDYRRTVVITQDGRALSGLVAAEDDRTLVLQTPTERHVIPTVEITQRRETSQSAMPDGMLDALSAQQIRDLVAYFMQPQQIPRSNP